MYSGKTTTVIFRKWKREYGKGVIALFPAEKYGSLCSSYEHVGQHAVADYALCIRKTTPTTPEEYLELLDELMDLGYDLKIRKRRIPNN